MKLDPKEVWKKAAGRAAAAPGNLAGGAVAVAASAALWNPLPLILWGLGAAGWVLYASASEGAARGGGAGGGARGAPGGGGGGAGGPPFLGRPPPRPAPGLPGPLRPPLR